MKSETSHSATSTYLGKPRMESKNKSTTSPKLSGIKCDQSLDIEKESDLSYSTAHPWPAVSGTPVASHHDAYSFPRIGSFYFFFFFFNRTDLNF